MREGKPITFGRSVMVSVGDAVVAAITTMGLFKNRKYSAGDISNREKEGMTGGSLDPR